MMWTPLGAGSKPETLHSSNSAFSFFFSLLS